MPEEKVLFDATLCYPIKDGKVLLGFKTRKIGKDKWNGYGGGIEGGETPEESALRELEEECGIRGTNEGLRKVGIIDFHNTKENGDQFICKGHIYILEEWEGEPEYQEGEAMINHTFFDMSNMPYDEMLPADKYILPHIFDGKKIKGKVHYGPFQKEILGEVEIEEINEF